MTASVAGGKGWLLASLALQNLGRRKARSFLLIAAVAVATGVIFTGATLMRSIDRSIAAGFARLGADLMVVPEGALTNITAALLVVEPTDLTLDGDLFAKARLVSVGRAAPQRIYRVANSGVGGANDSVDLVGFDPGLDFTIQPWLVEKINRDIRPGDVILGAGRAGALGSQLLIFGKPHTVYGRLGRTGVGTHERGLFMTFATLEALVPAARDNQAGPGHGGAAEHQGHAGHTARAPAAAASHAGHGGTGPGGAASDAGKVTGYLIELAPGATSLQARFAILSSLKGVKAISGDSTLSGIRQGLAALLNGILALMALMFVSTALMVCVLFSAIVTERRGELGLLKAIGARRGQIVGLMMAEAVLATGIGGALGVVLGVLVMRLYERSLVYYLENVGVPFLWLDLPRTIAIAAIAILLACLIGASGALYPAWRASRRDPYDLVRGEG
ncbi:FtsX-like permease family protein [soil metagenome]